MPAGVDEHLLDFLFSFSTIQVKYDFIRGVSRTPLTTVILARDVRTSKYFVLKLFRRIITDHRNALCALRSVKYLSRLHNPHVVKLVNVYGKKHMIFSDIFIETEKTGHDLTKLLTPRQRLFITTPLLRKRCMYHIFKALAYIHSAEIVHRNLKPAHVLYVPQGQIFQITSFSQARKIGIEAGNTLTRSIARGRYSAPEVALYPERHTAAIDIYSAGLILIQVLGVTENAFLKGEPGILHIEDILQHTGKPRAVDLIDLTSEQTHYILEKVSPDRPHRTWMEIFPEFSADATDLMENILHFSSSSRYSAAQALQHDFFAPCRNNPAESVQDEYHGPPLEDYPAIMSFPTLLQELNNSITKDMSTVHDTNQLEPFSPR